MNKEDTELLLSKGNMYKTLVDVKNDCIIFRQRRLLPGLLVGFFGAMGYGMSPWLGTPILLAAFLILVWFKQVKLFTEKNEIIGVTGIPPFLKTYRGKFDQVNYVAFREVVSTRNVDNVATGRWKTWDIAIYAFEEKYVFSVWEESNKEKLEKMSLLLSSIIGCERRRISPNDVN